MKRKDKLSPVAETSNTLVCLRSLVSYYEGLQQDDQFNAKLASLDADIATLMEKRATLVNARQNASAEIARLQRRIEDETRVLSLLKNPSLVAARAGGSRIRAPQTNQERIARVKELTQEIARLKKELGE